MRRLLIFFLVLAIAAPAAFARKKKERAGSIDKNVYTDAQYGFQLTMNEDWNAKVQDADDNFRVVMLKNRYDTPADYIDAPDYTTVPRLVVFAHNESLGAFDWVDSLLSDSYGSESKTEAMKEFEILQPGNPGEREDILIMGRKPIDLDGERGLLWEGQVKYMKEVAVSSSSIGGKRVRGGYGGAIVAVKKDGVLVAFHLITEWQYFESYLDEALAIINTLKWADAPSEDKK